MTVAAKDSKQSKPVLDLRIWRWSLAVLLFGAMAGGGGWAVLWLMAPANVPLERIRVEGNVRHTKRELLQRTLADTVSGNFFSLDLEQVRTAVEELPWVDRVSVRRVWPGTLLVEVDERRPLARWGGNGVVSPRGAVFEPDQATVPGGLARLEGPPGSAVQVVEEYQWMRGQLLANGLDIARLSLNARQAWSLELSTGVQLQLGNQQVRARLQRFLRYFPGLEDAARVEVVDVRYEHGFALRRRPRPEPDGQSAGAEG